MKHVIIDADTGIDDSIAILYALRSPNFIVEGITTCYGNSNAYQSAENSIRLIQLSKCGYEVPVVAGANQLTVCLNQHHLLFTVIMELEILSFRRAAKRYWMRMRRILLFERLKN